MPARSCRKVGPLPDAFSLMSFSAPVEVLRQANRLAGRPLHEWPAASPDGAAVASSARIGVRAHHAPPQAGDPC